MLLAMFYSSRSHCFLIKLRITSPGEAPHSVGWVFQYQSLIKKIPLHSGIQDTMRRPNLRIIGMEESKYSQIKGPVNIFNRNSEEEFLNLKKEMSINIQEAYKTQKRLDQKRNSSFTLSENGKVFKHSIFNYFMIPTRSEVFTLATFVLIIRKTLWKVKK